MNERRDKWLMRTKDIVLLVTAVGGLLAGVGKFFVLANHVEAHDRRFEQMEPRLNTHETDIAVQREHWDQIDKKLDLLIRITSRHRNDWAGKINNDTR